MGPMNSFFTIPALGGYEEQFEEIIDEIYDATSIRIVAPATLDGVVSMALIEASLIDVGKNFTRRFVGSRHQIPRDEDQFRQKPFNGLSIFLDVESEHVPADQLLIDSSIIRLKPIEAEVEFFQSNKKHQTSIDVVLCASILASILSPQGLKTRALRPFALVGLWSRGAMDNTADPMYTLIRNHFQQEGTIRVVPLPEIENPELEMLPTASPRMLQRLQQRWASMDFEARSESLSEFALTCVDDDSVSTARFEELIWKRVLSGSFQLDIASAIYQSKSNWPADFNTSIIHASTFTDYILSQHFFPQ